MKRIYSAPTSLNLEITDKCNMQCRHCYNFWRAKGSRFQSMSLSQFDRLFDFIVDSGIFHVVLTGGEPFANFEVLKYAATKLTGRNITVSCNSNLMMVTEDKLQKLWDCGVDHFLTSLNSHDEKTNDYMVNSKGAFKKTVKNIELAIQKGFRISVNMIIGKRNKDHVYDTAKFINEIGCQKIHATRTVPPVSNDYEPNQSDINLSQKDALDVLEQLYRAKEDTGVLIGTLVSYPLCLLGDLVKFKDFVGRGCPSQSGHRMSINANGDSHCCVHEEKNYGNVFKIGIKKAYENMMSWQDKSYRNPSCEGCEYIEICQTGCRMMAMGYYGSMNEKDPLMINSNNFTQKYQFVDDRNIFNKINSKVQFVVPKRIRFRKESGFYLVNIRWGNTIEVENETAIYLIKYQKSQEKFSLNDFGINKKELLVKLYLKDVIESNDLEYDRLRNFVGVSIDPGKLKGKLNV